MHYMHAHTHVHTCTHARSHVHTHKDTYVGADAHTRSASSIWLLSLVWATQLWSQAHCPSCRTPSTEHPAAGAKGRWRVHALGEG